VILVKRSINKK